VIYYALSLIPSFLLSDWLRRGCGFGLKSRPVDRGIELVHGLFISAWNQMSVTVHRDLN
jgi:hypothetical protein